MSEKKRASLSRREFMKAGLAASAALNLKIKTASPSIMDIAPTALELFGVTPPAHMDGRGLVDVAGLPGAKQRKPS
jgi:bisphosphoglycerate-independent phosphoglycerate mutase (AlkP superfamily)